MWIVYIVALIEGFSTLAVEIIALRLAAPITGSSSIVTSVFLGIILLALSAGYWRGGVIASHKNREQIRYLLIKYLIFAGCYYAVVSFGLEMSLLEILLDSTGSYILTLFVTALLLFFLPVFIASQTLPLLTELSEEPSKGRAAGNMLFASTVGSFLGSILTSIVLFQRLGVTLTAILVSCCLVASAALLVYRTSWWRACVILLFACLLCIGLWLFRFPHDPSLIYGFDSAYQQIRVVQRSYQQRSVHVFLTNEAYASAFFLDTKESPFDYVQEAVSLTKDVLPDTVLVVGTAGFTFPYEIATNISSVTHIDAVDIDSSVKTIAEKYFLQTSLPERITFYPESARYFVAHAKKEKRTYDLIFIDAFHGKSLPDELTTQEFFSDVRDLLSEEGVVIINFILDRGLESDLSLSLFATLDSVFGEVRVTQTTQNDEAQIENFIVTTRKLRDTYIQPVLGDVIYTDDRRSTELDTMRMYRQ